MCGRITIIAAWAQSLRLARRRTRDVILISLPSSGDPMSTSDRRHAVVLGASIAGLLAARVLSDHFEHVTVLDRDELPFEPSHRQHVPQSRHIHALLARGREALGRLFPGFDDEIVSRGGRMGDPGLRAIMIFAGHRHCPRPTPYRAILASRILIEDVLRERVRANPRIGICDQTEATGFLWKEACVAGVRIRTSAGEIAMQADLVMDCTGRGSRTPAWLSSEGFPPPLEEQQRIDVRYRSRHVRVPIAADEEPFIMVVAATPDDPRGGVIAYQDNGLYLCTLAGCSGKTAPADPKGFVEFAKTLARPDLCEVLARSEFVDEAHSFGTPSNLRRRYESCRRFPRGLLVMGDAISSFDPTYGQGMTVAAMEAEQLASWLTYPRASAQDWFRMTARLIDRPWIIATQGDAYVLDVPGSRRGITGIINRYLERLHSRASIDPVVADAFLRVTHLYDPPSALLRPEILWRVMRGPGLESSQVSTLTTPR